MCGFGTQMKKVYAPALHVITGNTGSSWTMDTISEGSTWQRLYTPKTIMPNAAPAIKYVKPQIWSGRMR